MTYNLGDYRYKNGKIYQRVWWIFFRCIDEGPHSYMEGVRLVNVAAGVEE